MNPQETNIHSSYPYTVIVNSGNQIVYIALPKGATWGEALRTFLTMTNRNSQPISFVPNLASLKSDTLKLYKDSEVIDWSNDSTHNVMAVEVDHNTNFPEVPTMIPSREMHGRVSGPMPIAVNEYLQVMQPKPRQEM
ncbi:hypothetical protein DQ04_07841040 [Trypanosoma grayi]|uniref:hypothetical protein n=1 Tax=Trypanosoma grayi TaxID=71804 RepID=UPI0004F44867|nr:hypothetical protein DQ04_07841040 [Trypanosoma grayi]KEG08171.1 hypothetical protein DQ04_07841040 [Trypanosoma grayi]